ncbi:hypothetical protein U0070_004064 [Myodes glareolus]|uniref:Eukaryotic translation initiation factor 4 gamma 2 n=1 Tax=Myodes glareolus TaxID=447135 RepID=A0AAW0KBI0_MYOGA
MNPSQEQSGLPALWEVQVPPRSLQVQEDSTPVRASPSTVDQVFEFMSLWVTVLTETRAIVKKSRQGFNLIKKLPPSSEPETEAIVTEYLNSGNANEAVNGMREMRAPKHFLPEMLSKVIILSLDRSDEDKEKESSLISLLKQEGIATSDNFMQAFLNVLEQCLKLEVDIPLVKSYLAQFAARAIISELYISSEVSPSSDETDSSSVPSKEQLEQEKKLLLSFKPVMQKFLHDHVDLQVSALYALQVHCYNSSFPKGMVLRCFVHFYDMEIIEEEAFLAWKEDITQEFPGKGKALFQVQMRSRWRKNVSKEGRIGRNLHPKMDGDGDGDPHWSTGLSPQGPNEERKEGEHEKGSQDREGSVHPLIQGDWSDPASDEGWRYSRKPTLQHGTEPPEVQMRSRRRKNMKNELFSPKENNTEDSLSYKADWPISSPICYDFSHNTADTSGFQGHARVDKPSDMTHVRHGCIIYDQEGENPNRLDPQNPAYAEETGPSVIVNGFSERPRASHSQRIRPNSENLARSRPRSVPVQLALVNSHQIRSLVSVGDSIPRSTDFVFHVPPPSAPPPDLGGLNPFIYMMDYIDEFAYVEPALHLWNEADLIIMDNFSNVLLDSIVGGGLALASAHLFDQMLSIGTSGIGSGSLVGQGVH